MDLENDVLDELLESIRKKKLKDLEGESVEGTDVLPEKEDEPETLIAEEELPEEETEEEDGLSELQRFIQKSEGEPSPLDSKKGLMLGITKKTAKVIPSSKKAGKKIKL